MRKQNEIFLEFAFKLQKQKDEFTTIASYELMTPLTILRATIQLMNRILQEKHIKDKRINELAKNAERHTKKLGSLVDYLLTTTIYQIKNLCFKAHYFLF
jgi:signal transduction histidine kinase